MICANYSYEKSLWNQGLNYIAGFDEVGRGCFAGPLVVAGVIFKPHQRLRYKLTDSKLLTAKKREDLVEKIKKDAVNYAIQEIDIVTINTIGLGKSLHLAFQTLLAKLSLEPDHILVDGYKIQGIDLQKQTSIIHGDRISTSIAAASIIAKVYRDELMNDLDRQFPLYNFKNNKGYGTKEHRALIKQYGLSVMHRSVFNLAKYV